jgi:hypothetical protein
VTFTATVSAESGPAPTIGTVSFRDNGVEIGTGPVNGSGVATFSTSSLAVGAHPITAVYLGATGFNPSAASNTVTQTVTAAAVNTTTTLSSSGTNSNFGQSVTFTATVTAASGPAPTIGSVSFRDNGVEIGTGPVNGSGVATFSTSSLAVGAHPMTAVYLGGSGFNASPTSNTVTQTVTAAAVNTTTTLGTSGTPSSSGQSVTFTATVTPASGPAPTAGTVSFRDNGTEIGTGTVNGSGVATFSTSALAVGSHPITAVYLGATGFNPSAASNTVNQVVNSPAATNTTTTLVTSNPSTTFGDQVTFTAVVSASSGPVPTSGTVAFFDGGIQIGSGPVNASGVATFATTTLSPGTHTITAQFGGTTGYNASPVSSPVTQTVTPVATTTTVTTSGASVITQPVTFTATVAAASGTAQGTVTFSEGATPLGTTAVGTVGGQQQASIVVSSLGVGTHTITATFNPATGFQTSTNDVTQTVTKVPTTVSLGSSATTITVGTSVTFTAQVVPTTAVALTPTGTITFRSDGTLLGSVAAGAGAVTFPTTALTVGTHTITADYSGDASFALATSAGVQVTVNATVPPPAAGDPTAVSGRADGAAQVFLPNAAGQYSSTPAATLAPFGGFAGQVRTAVGDVNNDGIPDTILVTGPGTPIRMAVVSGANNSTLLVAPTAPFVGSEGFDGGGFVAAADIDGDGRSEFVVTPDRGGGPRFTIFSLSAGGAVTTRMNFFGIDDPDFRGGARAAFGDVNGDHTPDLVACAGFLGGPRTALFNGTTLFSNPTRLVGDFFAFPGEDAVTLRNGVFAAAGDVNGDGFADLIFGGGPGGAPRVFILSGALVTANNVAGAQAAPVANFFVAGNASDRGGVRVASKDADGDAKAELVVGSGEGSAAAVRIYLGKNFTTTGEPATAQDLSVFGGEFLTGGVFVG